MDLINTNILPMEALSVPKLPEGSEWHYEPKWDGFRCLAIKQDGVITLRSKSGKPLERYFPDMVEVLATLKADTFMLDGELLIETEDGYSFGELQLRLHPAASRVKKLMEAYPASYMVFDLLYDSDSNDLMQMPFKERRKKLEAFYKKYSAKNKYLLLSPQTDSLQEAKKWVDGMGITIDGLIAKNIDDIYMPEVRQMQKYKFKRTADCVVGGFRYGTNSKLVGSLLLGLYDEEGVLNHVGFTSSIAKIDKPELTKKLEAVVGGEGFTGKAPGAPSRWSTERSSEWVPLKPKFVVEVAYDHVSDDRFRHGTTLIRWRPDKSPKQCKMEQLHQPKILGL